MKQSLAIISAITLVCVAAGCGNDASTEQSAAAPENAQAALPANLFLDVEPSDPISVKQLKSGEYAGKQVVVTGRIGGRAEPFVEDRAMFTMIDLELPVCGLEDPCETPWDSCCETPEDIKTNMITVQVIDENGQIAKADIRGQHGIEPMARLTLQGKVSQQDGDVVVLDAENIFVHADPGNLNIS